MEIQPDISICVIIRDKHEPVQKMLQSLYQTADPVTFETIIIDNGSTTPVVSELDKEFPNIKLFENNTTEPLAKAKNRALQLAQGRYISFWDDSIIFVKNCLKNMLLYLDENPPTGIAAPKILDKDQRIEPSARKFPTLFYLFSKSIGFNAFWPENPILKKHLIYDWDRQSPQAVDWLLGTAIIIRREVINEIGFFDEGFRLFYEDADYCRRARSAGWHIFFRPESAIWHHNPQRYIPTMSFDQPPPGSQESPLNTWHQITDSLRFLRKKWFGMS